MAEYYQKYREKVKNHDDDILHGVNGSAMPNMLLPRAAGNYWKQSKFKFIYDDPTNFKPPQMEIMSSINNAIAKTDGAENLYCGMKIASSCGSICLECSVLIELVTDINSKIYI